MKVAVRDGHVLCAHGSDGRLTVDDAVRGDLNVPLHESWPSVDESESAVLDFRRELLDRALVSLNFGLAPSAVEPALWQVSR